MNSVAAALARRLRDRFDWVIAGATRENAARWLAVDLTQPVGRKHFAKALRCEHFMGYSPWEGSDAYIGIWSYRSVGAQLRLTDASSKTTLWRARHSPRRSAGGGALSPISALFQLVKAGRFQTDADVKESIADDLGRRLLQTLPDMWGERAHPGSGSIDRRLLRQ